MTNTWTNGKGVKFIGQNGTVPAPEYKDAEGVDYVDWHSLEMQFEHVGGVATEDGNESTQTLGIASRMAADSVVLAEWGYETAYTVTGGTIEGAVVENIVTSDNEVTADIIIPVDVVEGDTLIIQSNSGGHNATITITVEAGA